jgi:hypothetical protein
VSIGAIFQCPKPLWMLIFYVALEGFATKPTQKTEPYFFFSTETQLKNKKVSTNGGNNGLD